MTTCMIMNEKIEVLLDETGTAFRMLSETGNSPNMDYAAYAAKTRIDCFRSALQNPELSRLALASMLRDGFKKKTVGRKRKKDQWTAYLARHIQASANMNEAQAVTIQ